MDGGFYLDFDSDKFQPDRFSERRDEQMLLLAGTREHSRMIRVQDQYRSGRAAAQVDDAQMLHPALSKTCMQRALDERQLFGARKNAWQAGSLAQPLIYGSRIGGHRES